MTWLTFGVLALAATGGCRRTAPALDTAPAPTHVEHTITGTVRGLERVGSIEGRTVVVVNVATNERLKGATSTGGSFTFKVRPGTYRVEIALRDGESLVKEPGVMHVERADAVARADFIVGRTRLARPRPPAYRTDDGLGAPIA